MVFIESRQQQIYEDYIFIDVSKIKSEVISEYTFENAKLFTDKSHFACDYWTASTLAMIFHDLENLYYKGCYFDEMCLVEKTCQNKKIEMILV
jgi:polyphosphate kinase